MSKPGKQRKTGKNGDVNAQALPCPHKDMKACAKCGILLSPVGHWGEKPLYQAKVGTTASNLIMIYRESLFRVNQYIKFATIAEVEGMSVGCAPPWRGGRIWKIESNRIFVERF